MSSQRPDLQRRIYDECRSLSIALTATRIVLLPYWGFKPIRELACYYCGIDAQQEGLSGFVSRSLVLQARLLGNQRERFLNAARTQRVKNLTRQKARLHFAFKDNLSVLDLLLPLTSGETLFACDQIIQQLKVVALYTANSPTDEKQGIETLGRIADIFINSPNLSPIIRRSRIENLEAELGATLNQAEKKPADVGSDPKLLHQDQVQISAFLDIAKKATESECVSLYQVNAYKSLKGSQTLVLLNDLEKFAWQTEIEIMGEGVLGGVLSNVPVILPAVFGTSGKDSDWLCDKSFVAIPISRYGLRSVKNVPRYVLCCVRSGRPYGQSEIQSLSNIAIRLAQADELYWANNSRDVFSVARTTSFSITIPPSENKRLLDEKIDLVLKHCQTLMGATTVTYRKFTEGWTALERHKTFPEKPELLGPVALKIEENTIVCRCAITGKTRYIPDVTNQNLINAAYGPGTVFKRSRDYNDARDTRSELSAPIFVNSRVIGVLNIESNRVSAFDDMQHFADSAALAIGQLTTNYRRAIADGVCSSLLRIIFGLHNTERLKRELSFLSSLGNTSEMSEVSASLLPSSNLLFAALKSAQKILKEFDLQESYSSLGLATPTKDILAIIEEAEMIRGAGRFLNLVFQGESREKLKTYIVAESVIVKEVLSELFSNAIKAAQFGGSLTLTINAYKVEVGGVAYARVCILSRLKVPSAIHKVRHLVYESPLQIDDHTSFGCYLSSLNLRLIGGDISLLPGSDFNSVIDLPLFRETI